MNFIEAKTNTGIYVGKIEKDICSFLGIRYVEPVGPWEFPKSLKTTAADRIDALEYGPQCLQPKTRDELASLGAQSYDCLTLNVWTKDLNKRGKPVMVYIHGGSYTNGGNADPITDGKGFIEMLPEDEDVVIAKINYRLGIFGCLDLSVLEGDTSDYEDSLELHLADQIAALKWIKENIAAFGGDSENITLFGQSAGSMSIAYLMANEEARQYFNRGIMMSGVPSFGLCAKSTKSEMSKALFDDLDIKNIDDLVAKDDAFWLEKYDFEFAKYAGAICPRVINGKYIKDSFFKDIVEGKAKDISLMVGYTTGEMDGYAYNFMDPSRKCTADEILDMLYTLYDDTGATVGQLHPFINSEIIDNYVQSGDDKIKRALTVFSAYATGMVSVYYANAQSKYNKTYSYAWNWMPDATILSKSGTKAEYSSYGRALHCADLPVLFNSGQVAYPALSTWWLFYLEEDLKEALDENPVPEKLSKQSVLAWYNFAKTGDPNNELIPEWKPFTEKEKNIMVIQEKWELRDGPAIEDAEMLYDMKIVDDPADVPLENPRSSAINVHAMER